MSNKKFANRDEFNRNNIFILKKFLSVAEIEIDEVTGCTLAVISQFIGNTSSKLYKISQKKDGYIDNRDLINASTEVLRQCIIDLNLALNSLEGTIQ